MKNNKILICGAFAFDTMATGGQPVKTRTLFDILVKDRGYNNVDILEISKWRKNPFKLLMNYLMKAWHTDTIIMLPAHNGVLVFSTLLVVYKYLFRKRIYYDVIGGWLPEKTRSNPWLSFKLKRFDGIWVETSSMKESLEKQGYRNVSVFKNFKQLTAVTNLNIACSCPFQLCTFSRVMEEKGISDAINAVSQINKKYRKIIYMLDIYGPIDDTYAEKFSELLSSNSDCVSYKGIVRPQDSVKIISSYFALLFPTHFYTEGIPGTIVDAYFAGVPVISSRWVNSSDVIEDNVTGFLYEFGNYNEFVDVLDEVAMKPQKLMALKKSCLNRSVEYSMDSARTQLNQMLN